MPIKQITALELQQHLAQGGQCLLLDVREAFEYRYAHIEGSVLVPLNELPQSPHLGTWDKGQDIVVICHHGMRSQQAAMFLEHNGFTHIANLMGGIDAWSRQCDSAVPRY